MTDGLGRSGRNRKAIAFAATFAALAVSGVALLLNHDVDEGLVLPFTHALVVVCATLITLVGDHVQVSGQTLSFLGGPGAVQVANGCNAVEVSILLAAAILAYPAKLVARGVGVVLCLGAIQTINLARIISLLFLSRYLPGWFQFFHLYVWDMVIVLDGVLVFFFWMRWQRGDRSA